MNIIKWLFGVKSIPYWLGSFAMILPLLTLWLAIPTVNVWAVIIIWGISQISFLQSITMLTSSHVEEIKTLKMEIQKLSQEPS